MNSGWTHKKNKGFTLIELLVVISIIALLSTVILANLNNARVKAQGSYTEQTIGEYVKAINLYQLDNDYYPTPVTTPITDVYCLGDYSPVGTVTTSNACAFLNTGLAKGENSALQSAFAQYLNGAPAVTNADISFSGGALMWRGATYQCKAFNSASKCTKIELDWFREDQSTNCSFGATYDSGYSAFGRTFCKLTLGN